MKKIFSITYLNALTAVCFLIFSIGCTKNGFKTAQNLQVGSSDSSEGVSVNPTPSPTANPTVSPTVGPTATPTVNPTVSPTVNPTVAPTVNPTVAPIVTPTPTPTSSPVAGAISLPIEVMSATTATVEVKVSVPKGSTATLLRMKANNLSYDGKASVQLNNGAWVSVTNAGSTVEGNGKVYGGIGGGYNTITLGFVIAGGVDGMNTVRFKFNGTDGISSGFRVLQFNLRNTSGVDLIDASNFVNEDPTKWTAPSTAAADIAAGEALWRSATLYESPIATSHILNAHCMDCHAQDGRDLHRFNYSNFAIQTRSMHHGLTAAQGNQIASYVRSLTAKLGVPGPKCRPWNPPYQPGPGLDSANVADWTCGAGVDAVVENDNDILNSIFPTGISKAPVATGALLNIREIPIGIQLPDWKHWLPRVHPKDAWGTTFTNSNLNKRYAGEGTGNYTAPTLRDRLTASTSASYITGKLANTDFFNDLYYWGVEWEERWPVKFNTALIDDQKKVYSTAQWLVVKNWELAQEFNFETLCPAAWTAHGAPAAKLEKRSWCGYWRFVFDASPHILGFPDSNNMFGSSVHDLLVANQWYYLAILLNPGSGANWGERPVDWQYAYGLMKNLEDASGRQEAGRAMLYITKGTQNVDNPYGVTDVTHGWTYRTADPTALWSAGSKGRWKNVPAATRTAAFNAYLETWMDRNEGFAASAWPRVDGPGGSGTCGWSEYRACWVTYVPDTLVGPSPTVENFPSWSYNQIPQMRADGIDGNLLNRYARYMNSLYPNGGFLGLVK